MAEIHERTRRFQALMASILMTWHGDAKPVCPEGRVIYPHGRPEYLGPYHAFKLPPPSCEAGQAALRSILLAWPTDYAELAHFDAAHGGGVRRTLVAAGLLLGAGTDDARERAHHLVEWALQACTSGTSIQNLDGHVAWFRTVPEPAPWSIALVGT